MILPFVVNGFESWAHNLKGENWWCLRTKCWWRNLDLRLDMELKHGQH